MVRMPLVFILSLLLFMTGGAVSASPGPKGPPKDAKVLFIFVDSLRPDVVDEMVEAGQLPFIKKHFYDEGLRFSNFLTIFPSLTVCVFGNLLAGTWPDQSGLKAQSLFERYPTRSKPLLKRLFFISEDFPRYFNLLTKVDKAPQILKKNGVKTLYDRLGEAYHPAVVPVSPTVTPWAWPHVAANEVDRPYRVAVEAYERLDTLNARYGLRYMVPDTRGRIFMLWFPEMDSDQHRHEWGQYSPEVRKKLEAVDRWADEIYRGLTRENNRRPPYVILFSDHGAYGGAGGIYNQPYYLGRDLFYKTFKMNVRGPDYTISHPGMDDKSFAYIDNMGRGQARIFLPVGDSCSGDWSRPNTFYELRHYGRGPNRKPVDMVRELLELDLSERNAFPGKVAPYPVDLLFVKISEDLIYVARRGGIEALIRIRRENGRLSRYLYEPVRNFSQDAAGNLTYEKNAAADPFGYLKDPKFRAPDAARFLGEFHDDREWLEATYETDYPDAISLLAHSLSWRPELARLAGSQDPDLWVSAAPGWNFRIEDIRGADHGSIHKESLRCVLMVSGPGVRRGVDPEPHRSIEVAPTLLQMLGSRKTKDLDAYPIEGIYED